MKLGGAPPIGELREHRDEAGRTFSYVLVRSPGSRTLGVHFSAFFYDAWGRPPTRSPSLREGYFHRLRMLGSDSAHNWVFLCDQYGPERNGCYYTGEAGDFFVERASQAILETAAEELEVPLSASVMVGSSMGATAALTFGLRNDVQGIVAVSPHIDLDTSAARQNRMKFVSYLCPDGDPLAPHNFRYTRQIRAALAGLEAPPPRLFMQTCVDDAGVYAEQVLPVVELWRQRGGDVTLDVRRSGGHTSAWAPRALLVDAVDRLSSGAALPLDEYQTSAAFHEAPGRAPLRPRLRNLPGEWRNRVLRRR